MSLYNLNAGYGQHVANALAAPTTGKTFYVVKAAQDNEAQLADLFVNDPDGIVRKHTTLDAAINATVSSRGDVIYVAPGYTETIADATTTLFDKIGVTIIGLGNGENRPVFTFATAAASAIPVSAANVTIKNCVFKCNIANQNHMFDVTAKDFTVEDCEFREGTSTGLSFITADTADNDSDRLKIKNCKFYAPTAGNMDNAIQLAKDFIGVRIEDCEIHGDFDDAGIHVPAGGNAQIDFQIRDCTIANLQSTKYAISINGTASTGKIVNTYVETDALATSVDAGGLEMFNVLFNDGTDQGGWSPVVVQPDSVANILGADDADNGFASTNVADNRDGSVLERLESIIATLRDDVASNFIGVDDADNVAATTNVAANRDGSILERLEAIYAAQVDDVATNFIGVDDSNNVAATTNVVANGDGSILERLELLQQAVPAVALDRNAGNYLSVTADFTSATWNTVAAHEIATVTGMVHLVIIPEVTGAPTSAGSAATLILGDETTTNSIIASTDAENLATGEVWFDSTDTRTLAAKSIFEKTDVVVGGGKDIGYTIGTEALTGGSIVFHMWWWPISSTGAVAAGAGGAL